MSILRRTGLVLALGTTAALGLPAAALADESPAPSTEQPDATSMGAGALPPASPLDLLLSTPGDVIGTLAAPSPI